MTSNKNSHQKQLKFFDFLQDQEEKNTSFTQEDILKATGWQKSTFDSYLSKGQLSGVLNKSDGGGFVAVNVSRMSFAEFRRQLSQSKNQRELGHNCKSGLSKALLSKSQENMLLALELYNRPSLRNRMDGFVVCFCIAWEQLLKAILIERDEEKNIYKTPKEGSSRKETISLRDCANRYFKQESKMKENLMEIIDLRDKAVHLLMPEIQGLVSRLLQAGVQNFTKEFEEFTELPLIDAAHAGMMSMVGDFKHPSLPFLNSRYGSVAKDIVDLAEGLAKKIEDYEDPDFAIPLRFVFGFGKKDSAGQITFIRAEDREEGIRKALVIEKPVDRSQSHPYREFQLIEKLNEQLKEKLAINTLLGHLPARDKKKPDKPVVNSHCFRAMVQKLKWKNSDNEYHYQGKNPPCHYYSEKALSTLLTKIEGDPDFVKKSKESYNRK
ncbi:MAG: DUF3644 domain-containing protein [Candidatus Cloacimonetes bacterium]|nr:DUF3644 domain-containing protein [Candidatus Cloacimonadota bacterium]